MFEWKPEYSVHIQSIDAQHQNLFAIGRELYAAMSAGHGKVAVGKILDRLVQYTAVHFAHEERLMKQYNYPDFAAHKAEHDALTAKVVAFQKEYEAGRATMAVTVLQFVKDWLEQHIRVSDSAYVPCLTSQSHTLQSV
jgi:hemerythrin